MKQPSSTMTGSACNGSSTPPMPAPPEIWQFLPIWAQEPTVAQVSTIVPSSTYAPRFTKHGISTTPRAMKAERRTMQFGTARNPAWRNRLSPQPSNFEGTLSHQFVSRPGPPPIGCMSFSRKDSRTAFLAHWLTVQAPSDAFSATRSLPSSRASSAASTASRTAPAVAGPTVSRSSHAASIMEARSARLMDMSGSKRDCPRKVAGRRRLSTRRETVSAMPAERGRGPATASSVLFDV